MCRCVTLVIVLTGCGGNAGPWLTGDVVAVPDVAQDAAGDAPPDIDTATDVLDDGEGDVVMPARHGRRGGGGALAQGPLLARR